MTSTLQDSNIAAESPRVLLVETHSPWESGDADDFVQLARTMLESGAIVRLHLIQNAVLWLQCGADALNRLRREFDERLQITFDDFSLDQRGIPRSSATSYGQVWTIGALVGEMADRTVKTIWHS